MIAEWFQNEKLKEWLSHDVTVKRGSTPTMVEWAILAWVAGKQTQCANVESNKTISEKKTTVTASMFNTYRVRNHFVPNPTNSKFIRLKKSSKNNFLLQ